MSDVLSFDNIRNLSIGTVGFVSAEEISVSLETDAPQNTALNTGVPTLFPRINGFVLIPNEIGALVGIIAWIGIEHSQYPKRKGYKDFDLIDLPFPLRKMTVSPVGTLKREIKDGIPFYKLERGVYSFPSVGDSVILPTDRQLKSIVENDDDNAVVKIGTAPIAGNANVKINPDKLFGRHIAILGNTGSGKSCSVAGMIRWSLEEAHKRKKDASVKLNCRFVILDPNGEYSGSFDDLDADVKRFKVELLPSEIDTFRKLNVPAWFWNSYEWISFAQASGKTQRPLLKQALRELRSGGKNKSNDEALFIRKIVSGLIQTTYSILQNAKGYKQFPGTKGTYQILRSFEKDIDNCIGKHGGQYDDDINALKAILTGLSGHLTVNNNGHENYAPYDNAELKSIVDGAMPLVEKFGGLVTYEGPDEDTPVPFTVDELPGLLELFSRDSNYAQYMEFFIMRIRTMLSDLRMKSIINSDEDISLEKWLMDYVSGLVIIDLALVPADIIHLIVAVISRVIFEAIQRYRKIESNILPTVIAIEEAHSFIRKIYSNNEDVTPQEVCSGIFEKIAREGRKFGLSLMISSQRPSELSDTVLSQCNTFFLHRIVNDRDQDLVRRLVPDNIGGLLRELPILPTGKAILLGWAAPIPILVEVNTLKKEHQPRSSDPDFWDVWTGKVERKVEWGKIANEWQKSSDTDGENGTAPLVGDENDDLLG